MLPSRRRVVRLRATAAALALGGLVAASGVVGYLAAPLPAPAVRDPAGRARSEFGAMLSELPLSSRPADALLVTTRADQLRAAPRGALKTPKPTGASLTRAVAVATLRRAAHAADHVRVAGTQQVSVGQGVQLLSAAVRVAFEPGQGTAISVLGRAGARAVERHVPPTMSSSPERLISLLLQNYAISGWPAGRLLGRPVTLVQAAHRDTPDQAVARWWIDEASGVVLGQETYHATGLALSARYTEVRIGAKPTFLPHLSPRLAVSSLTASAASSTTDRIGVCGWECPSDLVGMSLVEVRSDKPREPGAVHLMYSDGIRTVSVFEQPGALDEAPAGSRWDATIQAYREGEMASTATWQSGDTVFTVVSDTPSLLADVVPALPREASVTPTTMDRIQAGWSRIGERVTG